jgi:hypothetical protein
MTGGSCAGKKTIQESTPVGSIGTWVFGSIRLDSGEPELQAALKGNFGGTFSKILRNSAF